MRRGFFARLSAGFLGSCRFAFGPRGHGGFDVTRHGDQGRPCWQLVASADYPLVELSDLATDGFLDAGVSVSINSDDPPSFGGSLNDNYTALTDALNLGPATLAQLACNSFTGSFAPAHTITAGLQAIRARTGGA